MGTTAAGIPGIQTRAGREQDNLRACRRDHGSGHFGVRVDRRTLAAHITAMAKRIAHAIKTSWLWAVIGFVVCGPCAALALFWIYSVPAQVVLDAREVDGAAVRGGTLDIFARVNKNRDCDTNVERWLWQWHDVKGEKVKDWVPLAYPSPPPLLPGDDQAYIITMQLPNSVTPGQWYYMSLSRTNCSLWTRIFGSAPRISAQIPISVTETEK